VAPCPLIDPRLIDGYNSDFFISVLEILVDSSLSSCDSLLVFLRLGV